MATVTIENNATLFRAWLRVLGALGDAARAYNTGREYTAITMPNSEDFDAHTTPDDGLIGWADDQEARIGLDVTEFRAAVTDYCEARAEEMLKAGGAQTVRGSCGEAYVSVGTSAPYAFDCFIDARDALHSDSDNYGAHEDTARDALAPIFADWEALGYQQEPADRRGAHTGGWDFYNSTTEHTVGLFAAEDDGAGWWVWDSNNDGRDAASHMCGLVLDANKARAVMAECLARVDTARDATPADVAPGRVELGDANAMHAYDIECNVNVRVHANNRDQAARIAERAGYIVRSVNMIG